jgi:anti-anti-sigma factor
MSDEETDFDIASTQANGVSVVRVRGEIDLTHADAMQSAVEETSTSAVVLDLSGVSFLDSSGIRAIDRSRRRLLSEERSLLIASPPDTPCAWTLRVAGFDPGFVVESVDDALALGPPAT